MGGSLAAKAVVGGDSVVSATGTLLSAGTGTSRTQSVSAVDFSRTFGGLLVTGKLDCLLKLPQQELGKKGS